MTVAPYCYYYCYFYFSTSTILVILHIIESSVFRQNKTMDVIMNLRISKRHYNKMGRVSGERCERKKLGSRVVVGTIYCTQLCKRSTKHEANDKGDSSAKSNCANSACYVVKKNMSDTYPISIPISPLTCSSLISNKSIHRWYFSFIWRLISGIIEKHLFFQWIRSKLVLLRKHWTIE